MENARINNDYFKPVARLKSSPRQYIREKELSFACYYLATVLYTSLPIR